MKPILIVLVCMLLSCQTQKKENLDAKKEVPGLDITLMDPSVEPGQDFYRFANGKWLDQTEIPPDEGRWGGFLELREKNNQLVLDILNAASKNPEFKEGSDERKAIDFFTIGMDSAKAEKAGIAPIQKKLQDIEAIQSQNDIQKLLARLHQSGYDPFYGVSAFANLMDSDINSLYVTAGGLGLPNRDYYTKTDEKSKEIRKKYVDHIAKMFTLSGIEGDVKAKAQNVMDVENRLALASLTPIERRNIPILYNPMTVGDIQNICTVLEWNQYLTKVGINLDKVDTLIVTQPKFVTEVGKVIQEMPLESVKSYLKWTVINKAANYLNEEIVQANFDFYGKVIRGTEQLKPRWKRVLQTTNNVIGEAIGKVYVAKTFPPEARESAIEMVSYLKKAFEKRINQLTWMTDETKEKAIKKLNNMRVKIGYTDKWEDYSELTVVAEGEASSYLENLEKAWTWQLKDNLKDIGEPVDKEKWGMNPQTVNAYFNPLNNEIVFPAAILQPPFYNYTADAAVNYGGMGAVIGHEISHGFDDQGSKFDHEGNMINWWKEDDKKKFEELSAGLVAQFDAYEVLDSVFVQGKLTLGENIGDLGGLNAAYDALQLYLKDKGRPENIDGFSPEQRFFISWATIWRTKYRDETLRTQVLTDPHSPGMYRAVGPLSNMESFYEAFNVKEGDVFWKPEAERIKIW